MPNLANTFPAALYGDGQAVAHSFGAVTLVYDSEQMAAPESWGAMLDPAEKGKFSISPSETWGFYVLSAPAKLTTGDPSDFDAGWHALANAAPLVAVSARDYDLRQVFERKEIAFGSMYSDEAYVMYTSDLKNMRMAKPKKSMIAVPNILAIPKDSEHPELARKFIDTALSPAAQKIFAEAYASASLVKGVPLNEELKAWMPATAEDFDRLIKPDWVKLSRARDAVIQRWNTDVAPAIGSD